MFDSFSHEEVQEGDFSVELLQIQDPNRPYICNMQEQDANAHPFEDAHAHPFEELQMISFQPYYENNIGEHQELQQYDAEIIQKEKRKEKKKKRKSKKRLNQIDQNSKQNIKQKRKRGRKCKKKQQIYSQQQIYRVENCKTRYQKQKNLKAISSVALKIVQNYGKISFLNLFQQITQYYSKKQAMKIKRRLYDSINVMSALQFMHILRSNNERFLFSSKYFEGLPLEEKQKLIRQNIKNKQKIHHRKQKKENAIFQERESENNQKLINRVSAHPNQMQEQKYNLKYIQQFEQLTGINCQQFRSNKQQFLRTIRWQLQRKKTIIKQMTSKKQRLENNLVGIKSLVRRNRKQQKLAQRTNTISKRMKQRIQFPFVIAHADTVNYIELNNYGHSSRSVSTAMLNISGLKNINADLDSARILGQINFRNLIQASNFRRQQSEPIYQE